MAWGSDEATVFSLASRGIACTDEVLFSFRISGINISSSRNDWKRLSGKLAARERFEDWLGDYIGTLSPKDETEGFQLGYISRNAATMNRLSIKSDLLNSTCTAILRATPRLLRERHISVKELLWVFRNRQRP